MHWGKIRELLAAAADLFSETKNLCVWSKTNAGMGSLYRSRHELIFVFKRGDAPHINNVELGRFGRNRTNVWDYPGQNVLNGTSKSKLSLHPTVKPVALVADAIRDCSNRNGVILDPFGGAGTTLIAAEKTGRRACLIEIDPRYVDVTIKRWQNLTRRTAVCAGVGTPYLDNGPRPGDVPLTIAAERRTDDGADA
jgi:DNA modification methylase